MSPVPYTYNVDLNFIVVGISKCLEFLKLYTSDKLLLSIRELDAGIR
jgi:hypothetical protein